MDEVELQRVVEALIFASDSPLSAKKIAQIVHISEKKVLEIVESLKRAYQDHAFDLIQVAGGFQLVTRSDYFDWIRQLFKSRSRNRLSQAALEALAVIAYKQPVSRVEVEQIRGVNSDGVIGTLLERNLITIKGRADAVGRPLLYGTTEEFLRYFGLNDLSDLPRESEIEALLKEKQALEEEDSPEFAEPEKREGPVSSEKAVPEERESDDSAE